MLSLTGVVRCHILQYSMVHRRRCVLSRYPKMRVLSWRTKIRVLSLTGVVRCHILQYIMVHRRRCVLSRHPKMRVPSFTGVVRSQVTVRVALSRFHPRSTDALLCVTRPLTHSSTRHVSRTHSFTRHSTRTVLLSVMLPCELAHRVRYDAWFQSYRMS